MKAGADSGFLRGRGEKKYKKGTSEQKVTVKRWHFIMFSPLEKQARGHFNRFSSLEGHYRGHFIMFSSFF